MADNDTTATLTELTADIVAAFVSNNAVSPADLPSLIKTIYGTVSSIQNGATAPVASGPQTPAVSIKKSITPDYLICLEDGKKFKSLKRHLRTAYGMTPEDYRAKWGLDRSYPMVAPAYAASRSALAKSMGLGQGGRRVAVKAAPKSRKPKT